MPIQSEAEITEQAKTQAELIERIAELGGALVGEEDICFEGRRFVLPETLNLTQSIEFLQRKKEEETEETNWTRDYQFRMYDGAYCASHAIRDTFGMVNPRGTIFDPSIMVSIPVDVDKEEQVPFGRFEIAGVDGVFFSFDTWRDEDLGTLFRMTAEGPRKWKYAVEGVFEVVADALEKNSMYRGKAIDGGEKPSFMFTAIDEDKLSYSDEIMTQFNANVWSLIEHSDRVRETGQSLKRAVLFEGPYGTGKTMAAFLTAKKCVENGWTFIYCRPGKDDLRTVLATAKLYAPAAVFFEDLDAVTPGDPNSLSVMLDAFDGMLAKNNDVIAIATTNHVERIPRGMMRPGRLDAIIHVGPLDAGAAAALVPKTVPAVLLGDDVDCDAVGVALDGMTPAFAVEALDRAVRYAFTRSDGQDMTLTTQDLLDAVSGILPQVELMYGNPEGGDAANPLDAALLDIIAKGTDKVLARRGLDISNVGSAAHGAVVGAVTGNRDVKKTLVDTTDEVVHGAEMRDNAGNQIGEIKTPHV